MKVSKIVLSSALFLCLVSPVLAQENNYLYAVKFICGLPEGVTSGHHETAINIHNPQLQSTTFRRKAVIARSIVLPKLKPSAKTQDSLDSDGAVEITCIHIAQILTASPIGFGATGFVVIESPVELDVVAVYTKYLKETEITGEKNIVSSGPPPGRPPDEPFPRVFRVDPVSGEALARPGIPRDGAPPLPPFPPRKPIEVTAVEPGQGSGTWGTGMGLGLGVGVGVSLHVEYISPKRLVGGRYVSVWR